ncbi:MAG: NAD-dependent epimerase/dehydratase family protein [Chloroflexi bacterium]|nr:NAD-dependent epimerase/dehydratase family protein [Chloroflexota bacterium]
MSIEPAILARRYAGKTVLVTGGSGFIGAHLTRRLASYGAAVTSLSRRAGESAPRGVETINGDVRDESLVAGLIDRMYDYVFHLAAYSGQVPSFTDHEQSLTTNCLGLLNVLDAIRRLSPRTRLCFPSSRLVYGRTRYLPVDEEHPREALSFYGIHKRTCEEYCEYYGARWGVESVVLRVANPYGPHDPADHNRYNIANWMIDELIDGREVTIFGRGEQLRDYIYIDDAVDAMLAAAVDPRATGRIYNVGSGAGTPLADFVRAAIDAAGSGGYRFAEWPAEFLQVETGDYAADISRITGELGWSPRTALRDGIAATIAARRSARRGAETEMEAAA